MSSFLEHEAIKQKFKGKLVATVLNGYLSLRRWLKSIYSFQDPNCNNRKVLCFCLSVLIYTFAFIFDLYSLCHYRLVVQRTKLIDETQEILLELLEEMTTGTSYYFNLILHKYVARFL